jgi:hypothetical protein
MPSLYDELELVQSRSSADDDGPQPLDDNVSYADLDLVEDDDEDLDLVEDDDEEDETVEDPHTLVELMEPPTKERRLTIVRGIFRRAAKFYSSLHQSEKEKPRSKSVTIDMPRLTTVSPPLTIKLNSSRTRRIVEVPTQALLLPTR